jgi:hypothetical protein
VKRERLKFKSCFACKTALYPIETFSTRPLVQVSWNRASVRVRIPFMTKVSLVLRYVFDESGCLGLQLQLGGKFHLKLNIGERPIANKYREGKMKSTLKRELNST